MLIWRPEGAISTAQIILAIRITYAVEMLPYVSMTFCLSVILNS